MAKRHTAAKNETEKQNRPTLKSTEDVADESADLADNPVGPITGVDDDTVDSQAARLGDARIQTTQRRALAARIVQFQGNRHLQRVVASLKGQHRKPQRTAGPTMVQTNLIVHQPALQAHSGGRLVQRTSDNVILADPYRPNAQACLVHLHGDELSALRVAQQLFTEYPVNLVHLEQVETPRPRRMIKVDVPGVRARARADPNRIFERNAIKTEWNGWNSHSASLRREPLRTTAIDAVEHWRQTRLDPALERGRGNALTSQEIGAGGLPRSLPVVAFHNNTPTVRPERRGTTLSIHWFREGRRSAGATARVSNNPTDAEKLQRAFDALRRDPGLAHPTNPHIETGQDPDNFVLVTDWRDFVTFVRQGRNTVLQASEPTDDGSLSVLLRSQRYINVEARRGRPGTPEQRQQRFDDNLEMGREAIAALGVPRLQGP